MIRTYTATDECGNSTVDTQTITVVDTTDPELVGVPADLTIQCNQEVPEFFVTATDNCDDEVKVEVDIDTTPGCSDATYSTTYSFTAIDDCGNTDTDTYTLTVIDTIDPILTAAADLTLRVWFSDSRTLLYGGDDCGSC